MKTDHIPYRLASMLPGVYPILAFAWGHGYLWRRGAAPPDLRRLPFLIKRGVNFETVPDQRPSGIFFTEMGSPA